MLGTQYFYNNFTTNFYV